MRRFIWIGLMVLALSACSTRMLYNWLDWLIPWEVSDYVTLTPAQERQLDSLVAKALAWHKAEELPRYVDHLESLNGEVARPMTAEQVRAHFDRSHAHWDRLFTELIPMMVPFIQSFSDAQVNELLAEARKQERERREEYASLTEEERVEKANERIEKSIRKQIGPLTSEQKAIIDRYNRDRNQTLEQWLAYRNIWLAQLRDALLMRADTEQLTAALHRLLVSPDTLKSEQYLTLIEENRQSFALGMARIQQSMTSRQRQKLHTALGKLQSDFDALAKG
ncbi:DUF6279 family lipoprotein [Ferrimonas gelatinilytica]|uniref:DUF6279 family lipoprotein n=1 Tax=Ferrimonas gelatinilytica TaxID=1255257 RepID=A0ABP9RVY8_9GAMM